MALVVALPEQARAQAALEEITVTAQKRTEAVQKVPISITALGGETLERTGVTEITDLVRSVPGMSYANSLPGRSTVSIRGIVAASGAPTVGMYVDEYSVPSGEGGDSFYGSTDVRIFDLARVEVLRGPQGTLYGAGSMGGTIRYITTPAPLDTANGRAQASLSSTDGGFNYRVAAAAGTPIVAGKLGVRISALHEEQAGFIDRIDGAGNILKRNADSQASSSIRLAFLWRPDDSWEVTPSISYQRVHYASDPSFSSNRPHFQTIARIDEPVDDKFWLAGMTVKKAIGGVDLVSVSSYYHRKIDVTTDYTDGDVNAIAGALQSPAIAAPFLNTTAINLVRSGLKVFTQELRVASNDQDSPLRWVAGGFYADLKRPRIQTVIDPNFNAIATRTNVPLRAPNDWIFVGSTDRTQESYAGFADASYDVTAWLSVSAGVRKFRTEGDVLRSNGGTFGGGAYTVSPLLRNAENGTNPKFTVTVRPTENTQVYATASKGFRSGAPNNPLPSNNVCIAAALGLLGRSSAPASYTSDSLWNYELGTKNSFFGGKMMLNAAGYYVDWSGIPQSVNLISPSGQSCGYAYTDNVGKSSVKGGELEARLRATNELTLGATLAYTDAKVEADAPALGAVKGDPLQYVPRLTYTLSADWYQPLSNGMALTGRVDHSWRGESKRNFTRAADSYRAQSYGTTNISFGVETGQWTIEAFVRNLTDEAPIINDTVMLNASPFYQGFREQTTLRPRTIGVTGNYRF